MSNPAAPPTNVQSRAQAAFNDVPQSYLVFKDPDTYAARKAVAASVPTVLASLAELDMELRSSFLLPLSGDEKSLNEEDYRRKRPFAMANKGKVTCRVRSLPAMNVLKPVYESLPAHPPPKYAFAAREVVGRAMENKISVDGGTENCAGRLADAYPKLGSSIEYPPTPVEVQQAMSHCGINLFDRHPAVLRKIPFTQIGDERSVKVNTKADCGFPLNVKWEHNGAAEAALKLANRLYADCEYAYRQDPEMGIWRLIRRLEDEHPWLVALKGKCKADAYSQQKIEDFKLRFYNALPKQFMLIIQSASQVMEEQSRNILDFPEGRSMSGVALVRDGPERLADAFEAQLRSTGKAHVHMGDDTKISVRTPAGMVLFSLDCSNFDITQHGEATAPIHQEVRDQLSFVDPVAAQVWYAFARERVVVTYTNVVTKWKHGGPSGMPLQSKVNDVLMEVLVRRILDDPCVVWHMRASVEDAVRRHGRALGLDVRLEDYEVAYGATTYREALEQVSFLFVGYRFFAEEGVVKVCADIPRCLAQFPFPALKWEADKQDFEVMEAVRIASIALNLGNPPPPLVSAFGAFRHMAERLLVDAINKHGDKESDRIIWAVQHNPLTADPVPNLSGLLGALRDWRRLWEPTEMRSVSTLVPIASDVWADQVEIDEEEDIRASGSRVVNRPAALAFLKQARLMQSRKPTHPPTLRNAGRPPPTAVWGPDKPPKMRLYTAEKESATQWLSKAKAHLEHWESQSEASWGWSEDDYTE